MLERQKRLNEVYEHLHNHFGVHSKGEFADIIKYARAYISSAMNGNERYLTDKLFTNICEAYPGVFNLDYLLTGNGTLLTIEEEVKAEQVAAPTAIIPPAFDFSIVIEHAVKVPVTRNRITRYTGHLFDDTPGEITQTGFGFTVDADWDGIDEHTF